MMGASESKDVAKTESTFSNEEKVNIEKFYHKHFHSKESYMKQLPFPAEVSEKLFSYTLHLHAPGGHKQGSSGVPSLAQYHAFLAQVLKGSISDKAHVFYSLCSSEKEASCNDILKVCLALVGVYRDIVGRFPHFKHIRFTQHGEEGDRRFCRHLLQDLFSQDSEKFPCQEADVESWIYKCPLFGNVFDTVFPGVYQIESDRQLMETLIAISPVPEIPEIKLGPIQTILDVNLLVFLNASLSSNHQCEWRLLFSNSLYGDSFSQLVSKISNKGPSLMVVRDKGGHVFGGFASHSWECKPKFYGESSCFLFTLSPQLGIYTPTMYNENFMYLNQGQETLPNGLGMGGQFQYFGFWIDSSFNLGHSKAKPKNTTYGSPQLSSLPEFEVDIIEVWAVGREPKSESDEEADEEKPKKSILDRDPESKAMLELLGKHQASEGMRERDEKEEETEEMRKKMNTIPKLL